MSVRILDRAPRPAPYPSDTRAKGWRFELDYEQIEQSSTWGLATTLALEGLPLARPLLLAMWYAAWKQAPCGSLPVDDRELAGTIGIPHAIFADYREVLLRGWWQADDGRLYHDTLIKCVEEMMRKRRSDTDRQAARRARITSEQSATHADVTRDTAPTHAEVRSESSTEHRVPKEYISNPAGSHPPAKADGRLPTVPCPYQEIVERYHDALPMLPRVRLMGDKRKKAMRDAWAWVFKTSKPDGSRRATNAEEALQWFADYFDLAAANDFLTGKTPRSAEHASWRCDLDFLLTERGRIQVIEKTQEAA